MLNKILFLTNGIEVRMNGTCAGGTGAFIDQMATLLNVPIDEMNGLAEKATKTAVAKKPTTSRSSQRGV